MPFTIAKEFGSFYILIDGKLSRNWNKAIELEIDDSKYVP